MTEKKWTTTIPSEDIPGILKTIRLFLETIKFNDTIKALEGEIKSRKFNIASNSTPKFLILTPSSISTSCKNHRTDLDYYPVHIFPKCYRVQSVENVNGPQDIDVCYAEEIHPNWEDSFETNSSDDKRIKDIRNDSQKMMCVTFRLLESIKVQVNETPKNELTEDSLKSTTSGNPSEKEAVASPSKTDYCKCVQTSGNTKESEEEVEINTSPLSTSDSNELSELYYRHFDEFEVLHGRSCNERSHSFTNTDCCNNNSDKPSNTQENVEKTTFNNQMGGCQRANDENDGQECCCTSCMDKEQVMDDGKQVSYTEYAVAYGAVPIDDYFALDFQRVKYHLLKGTDLTKELLLQALRWRITQTSDEIRNREIQLFIRNNLFGLKTRRKDCEFNAPIIKKCLEREPEIDGEINDVQTNAARILNCFASLKIGRDYLCDDEQFLKETLLPFVINEKYVGVVVQDMLIATLQKMSLRKRSSQIMIEEGLIQYLVTFLSKTYETLNDYCLEYSVALLMNLCLQKEAKSVCKNISDQMVNLLTTLLCTTRECCMPYVNGTLFAILRDKTINAEAKEGNLGGAILNQAKITKNQDTKNQLEFIYKMHMKDNFEICPCRSNTGPENEMDLLEPELDIADSVRGRYYGESLLQFYRLEGIEDNDEFQKLKSLKCFCKPALLNRNVKPYNVVEQGIIPSRKKNTSKVMYEVYLDPVEKDKLIEKIEQEEAENASREQLLESQSEIDRDRKRVSFKEDETLVNEVDDCIILHTVQSFQDEQLAQDQEQYHESQTKEDEAEKQEEKKQLEEIHEEEAQTEEEQEQPSEEEREQQPTEVEREQQQTDEKQLPSTEKEQDTCEEVEEEPTKQKYQQTEEEQEQKQEEDEFLDQTDKSGSLGSIEILKEPVDATFPSIVQYDPDEIASEDRDSFVVYISVENEETQKHRPKIDFKNVAPVGKQKKKVVPKSTKYTPKRRPETLHKPTPYHFNTDQFQQQKKHWDAIKSKPKPKLAEYKQPKPKLAEYKQPKPKCEQPQAHGNADVRMPMSYYGCYRDYSNTGILSLVCPKHTKRNKYSCGCYDKIKDYVDQLDCNNYRNNNWSNNVCNSTYLRCHMMGLDDCSTPDCSSRTVNNNLNCQNAATDDVDMTIPYYNCDVLCQSSKYMQPTQCHYYNAVFQSRPKIGRTPPH